MAYNPAYITFDINPFDEAQAVQGLQDDMDALLDTKADVNIFPIIITQPTDYTGPIGATATFSVVAAGESLSYQWQYKSAGSSTWGNISSGTSSTFTREITAARDGQSLRCNVTDASSGRTVTSDAGTIHVAS